MKIKILLSFFFFFSQNQYGLKDFLKIYLFFFFCMSSDFIFVSHPDVDVSGAARHHGAGKTVT